MITFFKIGSQKIAQFQERHVRYMGVLVFCAPSLTGWLNKIFMILEICYVVTLP